MGIEPTIWRRILITDMDSLETLNVAIQIAMGWTNTHMHLFTHQGTTYGVLDEEEPSCLDEQKHRIKQLLMQEGDEISYFYDFGDDWEHKLELEKVLPFDTRITLPQCIEGSRACPPENVGGPPGYATFLEAIDDPYHPEHKSMLEWIGPEFGFDPEHLDLAETNFLMKEYLP